MVLKKSPTKSGTNGSGSEQLLIEDVLVSLPEMKEGEAQQEAQQQPQQQHKNPSEEDKILGQHVDGMVCFLLNAFYLHDMPKQKQLTVKEVSASKFGSSLVAVMNHYMPGGNFESPLWALGFSSFALFGMAISKKPLQRKKHESQRTGKDAGSPAPAAAPAEGDAADPAGNLSGKSPYTQIA